MYCKLKIRCKCLTEILSRSLSSAEISTALRPFYFSVHPDLFGKYPEQRKINENSLQQLSALLEAQQSSKSISLPALSFYLRQRDMPEGVFKYVKIKLNGSNVRETVIKVLNACDLSTTYVDKIPRSSTKPEFSKADFTKAYEKYTSEFDKATFIKRKVEEKKAIHNIIDWIYENSATAKEKYESTKATRDQVKSLIDQLCETYGIKEVGKSETYNFYYSKNLAICELIKSIWLETIIRNNDKNVTN